MEEPLAGPLLVIDDVYSTGRTAAVLAQLLRNRFGRMAIVVACPLRAVDEPPRFKAPTIEQLRAMDEEFNASLRVPSR
jgi:adenine/guanine phosphoribosyltransferase-like PRPP-binding protein